MGVVEIQSYGHDDDDLMVLNTSGAADETLGEAGSREVSAQFKPALRMKLKVSVDDLVVWLIVCSGIFTRDNNNLLFPLAS